MTLILPRPVGFRWTPPGNRRDFFWDRGSHSYPLKVPAGNGMVAKKKPIVHWRQYPRYWEQDSEVLFRVLLAPQIDHQDGVYSFFELPNECLVQYQAIFLLLLQVSVRKVCDARIQGKPHGRWKYRDLWFFFLAFLVNTEVPHFESVANSVIDLPHHFRNDTALVWCALLVDNLIGHRFCEARPKDQFPIQTTSYRPFPDPNRLLSLVMRRNSRLCCRITPRSRRNSTRQIQIAHASKIRRKPLNMSYSSSWLKPDLIILIMSWRPEMRMIFLVISSGRYERIKNSLIFRNPSASQPSDFEGKEFEEIFLSVLKSFFDSNWSRPVDFAEVSVLFSPSKYSMEGFSEAPRPLSHRPY